MGENLPNRRLQPDHLDRLAVGALGQPLVMAVHHVAIRRHQDGSVVALEGAGLVHLGLRELSLRGLEVVGRHFGGAAVDAARLEEVHQGTAVLGLDRCVAAQVLACQPCAGKQP